jgi:nicotinate-nucleotide adenylyltransferase
MAAFGILGGTFDPIHYGHLRFAEDARDRLRLTEVRLVPTGVPPHRIPPQASGADRLAMVQLALANSPGLRADDIELRHAGTSYTVRTLQALRSELGATPLCLLLGADALAGLASWHRWRELFDLAHLVVAARPGSVALEALPPEIMGEWSARMTHDLGELHDHPAGRTFYLPIRPHLISASDLRRRLATGERPRDLLPPSVLAYIDSHHIYRNRAYPTDAS